MKEKKNWAVVPFVGCLENTKDTVEDLLQQTIPVNVLLVDNGSTLEEWKEIREFAAGQSHSDLSYRKVFPWRHSPALPSLAATWNVSLDFIWASGGEEAMVCNNDIRVRSWMYATLLAWQQQRSERPLFISGINSPEGYEKHDRLSPQIEGENKGGPDFSCFLITKAGHDKYRFDEGFVPAYCEDLDMHRRYMLGGDGGKIFSVNLPYLHKDGGSGTLKSFSEERRKQFDAAVNAGSRKYYKDKWGGGANEEKFVFPFNNAFNTWSTELCPQGCVTTPQLQAHNCGGTYKCK